MYLFMKTLHILAVILFVGNIITGVFWKIHGDSTGDRRIMAHTMRGIIRADRWFTNPGVILLVIGGFGAAGINGMSILGTGWIWQSLILLGIAGVAFVGRIAPLQRRLASIAGTDSGPGGWDEAGYRRLSRQWAFWGLVATITPLAAIVLMVFKPGS